MKGIIRMELEYKLPEDFEPYVVSRREYPSEVYFIHSKDGKMKNYIDAEIDDVLAFVKSIIPEKSHYRKLIEEYDEKSLALAVNRAAFLNLTCNILLELTNNWFGTKEYWERMIKNQAPGKER
jgi:hypothetical protein